MNNHRGVNLDTKTLSERIHENAWMLLTNLEKE